MVLSVITFIGIGLIAGVIVSLFFKSKKLFWGTVFAGIVGSVTGGILYSAFSIGKMAFEVSPLSLVALFIGTIFFVGILSVVSGRSENY